MEHELIWWAPQRKHGGGWICFGSSPKPPAAPDPNVVSAAQTKSNIDTANANANLNRTNQVTPWGTLTYSKDETANPDGTYNWTATTALSPAQQKLMESSDGISQSMADLGQQQIRNVADTSTRPLDFSGLPQVQQAPLQSSVSGEPMLRQVGSRSIQYGVESAGDIRSDIGDAGQIQRSLAQSGPIQDQVRDAGKVQQGIDTGGVGGYQHSANYGQIQDKLDTTGVPSLVGGDALAQAMREQQQAAFSQQKGYLDPQWQQAQHDLENKLVQQGVMQNSDAWNRAMGDMNRQRTFAYQNANDNSVALGNSAQAQLYGQGLSSNQNAFAQAMGVGNFANAAQAQGFGQAMQNAQLNNDASTAEFHRAQAMQEAANAAQGQQYGQNLTSGQFSNAAQGQRYGQNLGTGEFANAAQGQQFNQNINAGEFSNAAQGQQYSQNANDMAQANAAQGQDFGQRMANANLYNAVGQSDFGNRLASAQLGNQASAQLFNQSMGARNQGINELLQQQQNPINVLNALRTGSQVTSPTFGPAQQSNIGNTDVMAPYNNMFNAQMGAYNGDIAQGNSRQQGVVGLIAAAAAAY